MAVPLQTQLFWRALSLVNGTPLLQRPPDQIRAASDRRQRLIALPVAPVVTGWVPRGVDISEATATLADGTQLPLRVYRPAGSATRPVVVNFHGGGFVAGDARQSEWWCASIAQQAEVVVVSVDYRLAPEHRFPVAVEDCYAATAWVVENAAELDVDATQLAVMGDSAGGNLAAAVCLMARDRGQRPAIALQVLIYPVVELLEQFASEDENANAPVLTRADMRAAHGLYCADEADAADPYASPLRASSHAGLPPALIQTAHHDPLRDQGPAYAAALRSGGVPVRLTDYADAVHGYISIPGVVPVARQALAEAVAALAEALSAH